MKKELSFSIGAAILLILVAASGLLFFREDCHDFSEGSLQVDDLMLSVAVAETKLEQTRGLMGCRSIPEDSGMYFVYDQPSDVQFWMRGVLIPLDLVWVTDGRVVGITERVLPVGKTEVDPPRYAPPRPITGVLEIPSGFAHKYSITEGSIVTLIQ